MTSLLFAIDFFKQRSGIANMENQELSLHFDDDNITTLEEILMTKMDSLLLKRVGITNPFNDKFEVLDTRDDIYLNDKEQLIRIVK